MSLAAVYIVGCAVSLIFVGMRLSARCSIAGVGVDDWFMLLTWVSPSSWTVPSFRVLMHGVNRSSSYQALFSSASTPSMAEPDTNTTYYKTPP